MTHPMLEAVAGIEVFDPRLAPIVAGARLEQLCTGARWSEGPVWMHEDGAVLWSDIPNDRMLRWSEADGMSVWRTGVEFTNGHTRDLGGDLLHCSHGQRAIVRTRVSAGGVRAGAPDEIVVDRYLGRRLNSPNDIVVKRDGTIWFTDPPYGIASDHEGHKAEREQPANFVFRFDPSSGVLDAMTGAVQEPNGLAFSPDESLLYVSDTSAAMRSDGRGQHHLMVFDVRGGALANARVFAEVAPGLPDGFRLDAQGWIYTSSLDSVQVYHPDGALLGKIRVPEKVGNLTFGGARRDQLYIAASSSLYRITLRTEGIQRP
ncbi:Gluconolactonase precursor (plasmid) [Variovorax sp. SRS16]|uniref:SMP-30/gluconolactonase/LRE family protein n=1 Tax=Variovorax sp. SRS16 TaxID=282217 RepID=UPI0013173534|nr:SMP-30/gluconolactonase/LRE family protein [Variovorax sp. SRS16]VTU46401.1 Gluconolactonase precursor [Variovorax sp. SRS16]